MRPFHLNGRLPLAITLATLITLAALTFIVLAQDTYPLTITDVVTTDYEGNTKTSFVKGEVVNVKASVEFPLNYDYSSTLSYLALIRITDPASRMLILSHSTGSISQQETKELGGGGLIPLDAPSGTYEAKVFIWNGWVSVMGENWESYAAPASTTFSVTAS